MRAMCGMRRCHNAAAFWNQHSSAARYWHQFNTHILCSQGIATFRGQSVPCLWNQRPSIATYRGNSSSSIVVIVVIVVVIIIRNNKNMLVIIVYSNNRTNILIAAVAIAAVAGTHHAIIAAVVAHRRHAVLGILSVSLNVGRSSLRTLESLHLYVQHECLYLLSFHTLDRLELFLRICLNTWGWSCIFHHHLVANHIVWLPLAVAPVLADATVVTPSLNVMCS